jgi:hypothetical protein
MGFFQIFTITEAESVQPYEFVTTTVYRVVSGGEATELAIVASDNPVAGDHWYRTPPDAVMMVVLPSQIPASLLTDTAGAGFTCR